MEILSSELGENLKPYRVIFDVGHNPPALVSFYKQGQILMKGLNKGKSFVKNK